MVTKRTKGVLGGSTANKAVRSTLRLTPGTRMRYTVGRIRQGMAKLFTHTGTWPRPGSIYSNKRRK